MSVLLAKSALPRSLGGAPPPEVAAALVQLPRAFGQLGLAVVVQSYGLPLGAFVELQQNGWSRAEGSHDRHGAEWEPTEHTDLTSPERRAEAIREWLKKLLRDSGIRGHEADIEAMPTPQLPTL